MHYERVNCKTTRFCTGKYCSAKPISRNTTSLNVKCNISEAIEIVLFHITLFYRTNSQYHNFLIDQEENMCNYIQSKRTDATRNPLLSYLREVPRLLKTYTNLYKCPWIVGELWMHDLQLGDMVFNTTVLPNGQYRADVDFRTINESIISMSLYFNMHLRG